jgi:hypothetical protein
MLSPSTFCATLAGFYETSAPFLRAGVPIAVTPSKNSVDWCYVIRNCLGIELDSFWLILKPYPYAFSSKLENCQPASSANTNHTYEKMQARDPTLLGTSNHMHSTCFCLCSDHDILCILTLASPLVSSCTTSFEARWQNCEKLLLASSCLSVCPSVRVPARMEQLGSRWTDFHELWCLSIFRISAQVIKVSLKSDKINRYFPWRPLYMVIVKR